MVDRFWDKFGVILDSFWGHFGVILDLGGLSWGPLAFLGPMLGSTSDLDTIFDQIREKGESITDPFGDPFYDYFAYADVF